MSKASVTINANSSQFQQEMKKCVQRMRELSSESSLAATQTKLFGSAQDQLRQKIQGLEKQIKAQTDVVELNKTHAKELTDHLQKWQQKQTSLQKEIEETKKAIEESAKATGENSDETQELKAKLTELQSEEKKVAEQVGKCEDKISKHTVATNKSEQALAQLQVELKETNQALKDAAWEKWEKGATKAGDAMQKVGKAMIPVTTAVVGLGTAAVKTTADFDTGMSAVQAISGATGDDLDALREKALEMGSKTAFSASEAAQAMEYMAMAGWDAEDMLAGIEGIMAGAAASGEDLALTSDIVTDGLTAFGMAASEAGRFTDVLVKAGNSANTTVSMMGETFKYAGAVCGTLGITIEDAAIATGLMANAGIKGSQAGTALRSGLTNLIKPTEQMEAAMNKYGVSIQTTEDGSVDFMATMKNVRETLGGLDETTQAAAIAAIFGKEAMSGWAAIVNATEDDFQGLTAAIYGAEGAAQEAANVRLDNLNGQFTILKSTLEGIAIQIGDILMPTIKKVVAKIQEWATAFSELDEDQKKQIVTIAGVVAAIGPVLTIIGKVVSAVAKVRKVIDGLKKTFTVAKTGIKLLTAAFANPVVAIVAVVAAIVGLIAYLKHLWDTNEDFRNAVTKIWNNIKKTAKEVWEGIKTAISEAFEKAKTAVTNTADKIKASLSKTWDNIKSTANSTWENIKTTISNKIDTAKTNITNTANKIKTTLSDAWNNAKSTATSSWENIKTQISTKIEAARKSVADTTNKIKTTMSDAWNSAKTTATSLWENIRSTIASKIDSAKATVSSVVESIKTAMSNAWNSAKNTVTSVWESIRSTIAAKIEAARATVQNIINTIKSYFNFSWSLPAVGTAVLTTAKNAVSNAVSAVKGFLQFTWNLPAIGTGILQTAKNAVSSAVSSIKGLFNFSWSLPKIKTPHFYISGYTNVLGVSIPSIGVSWYKNGGIMVDPTMFGRYGGTAMVGGEAGPEAILPLEPFYTRLTAIIDKKLDEISHANATLYLTVVTEMDGDVIAQRTTPMVADEIVKLFGRRR